MSQGLSYNAFLEVTAQLRLQNQELSDRLASQQSVNGSVMAQARHTPATFSDAPSVHPAAGSTWETVKAQARHTPATNSVASVVHPAADAAWKAKKTKSGPAERHFCQVIIQDGWSVPVVHSFEGFRLADTGICLATRSETEEAMRELRLGGGLAVLTTKQIVAGSEEIEFEVKTSQGLSTMWKRYLVQLGDVPVTYKCSAPRGEAVEADTSLAVIGFHRKYCQSRCVEDSHDPTEVSYRILPRPRHALRCFHCSPCCSPCPEAG